MSTQVGYAESFGSFLAARRANILQALSAFVSDAGQSQMRAWQDSLRILSSTVEDLCARYPELENEAHILLEYTIPLESRRIDAALLLPGTVIVLEFKGNLYPVQADIDQAAAYGRDLRAYHRECSERPVRTLLVMTRSAGVIADRPEVTIIGPDQIPGFCIEDISLDLPSPYLSDFVSLDAYQPLPSLIKAARELFQSGSLTRIHRAAIATEPTIQECSTIIHKTAQQKRRALILKRPFCGSDGKWSPFGRSTMLAGHSHFRRNSSYGLLPIAIHIPATVPLSVSR